MAEEPRLARHNGLVAEVHEPSGDDVTVVIPAFNAEVTLGQALASVAAQGWLPGEVIVVDDCSTDHTVQVAERWQEHLPVTVLALASNSGPAVARHEGIRRVSTPLVALLDSDDCWLPDHLESMLSAHRRTPGLITADALPWVPGSTLATRSLVSGRSLPPPERQLEEIIARNFVFVGTLFATDLYFRVGGFRPQFRGTEDWDLWVRMARAGVPISRPDHPTVLYRMSTDTLSARDEQVAAEQQVVHAAQAEATQPREQRALARKSRELEARQALFDAYGLARDGRSGAARRRATGALRGHRRVVLRALAVIFAPSWAARQRDARRFQPRWWFKRL